jgi:hypothetical protein
MGDRRAGQAIVTSGGVVRLLCTVQWEATASSASRRSSGTPSGTVIMIRTATTRAGRGAMP